MRLRLVMLGAAIPAAIFACVDLKPAVELLPEGFDAEAVEDGGLDAAIDDDSANLPAETGLDTRPPPDFECPNDEWTKTSKTKPECAPRQVRIIDADGPIDVTSVSIARTPAGRVGVGYNAETDADNGIMRLVHFVPSSAGFTPAVLERTTPLIGMHLGYLTKLAASAPDTLHVLAHDVDSQSESGEVLHLSLVNGKGPLSTPELVASTVRHPTEIGLAVDAAGAVFATARIPTETSDATTVAKLAAWKKPAGGTFGALDDVTTTLRMNVAPGTGAASLVVDVNGHLHLLYHHCESLVTSVPRYRTLAPGGLWSYPKSVEPSVVGNHSGYSPRIAVHSGRKYAAYFSTNTDAGTAQLRLATWSIANDKPSIEILDQGIRSPDAQFPRYRVAMAVDIYGLVHLAIVRPIGVHATDGTLEYIRQTRVDGATKWLIDIVDSQVLSESSDAFVDMVVDDVARPHIAYRSGVDLKVRYATRYDR